MADSKISALPASTTPLAGTEVLPIVQSSTTRQVSVANLTAGRAIGATSIQFGSGTVLSVYEEGSCSITLTAGLGTITSSSVTASYTKTGRVVTITGVLAITNNGTGASVLNLVGLPFTPATSAAGVGREGVNTGLAVVIYISATSTTAQMFTYNNLYPVATNSTVNFTMSYIV
jgi:hypothetical protein